ncbi:MAG TPA: GNAT family N-acetyltransferase [Treponemataceae bacterium]|nr:GNAT family N-acetyltransferase [Treponemataceae bacterium]
MSFAVIPVAPASALFAAAVDFVKPREWRAASLASNLVADGMPSYPGRQIADFVCLAELSSAAVGSDPARLGSDPVRDIVGVILRTSTGIVLHCFKEGLDLREAKGALKAFLARKTVRSILGPGAENRFLESLLADKPYQTVDYRLMSLPAVPNAALEAIPGALEAGQAQPDEVDLILPLQEGYEKEEVIPPGDPFNRAACRINLAHALERQRVLLARANGIPVAKAGTNARGFAYDQIGGVYTAPSWRGQGLATALVSRISRELMGEGRKVVLFVKPENEPARRAYEKAGFKPELPFRIAYF